MVCESQCSFIATILGGNEMVKTRTAAAGSRHSRARSDPVGKSAGVRSTVKTRHANAAEAAAKDAWTAVTQAVQSGRTQPANVARATGKAVSNVAKTGAKQTGATADQVARAAEIVLMSAMSEATAATKAARDAAREVERSVGRALKAIRHALRMRAHVAIDTAAPARAGFALKRTTVKSRRASPKPS